MLAAERTWKCSLLGLVDFCFRLVAVVFFEMNPQLNFLPKRHGTLRTRDHRLLRVVPSEMTVALGLSAECRFTLTALVRLFTCMNAFVFLCCILPSKFLFTVFALVRTLTDMNNFVQLQVPQASKLLTAVFARKGLVGSVNYSFVTA